MDLDKLCETWYKNSHEGASSQGVLLHRLKLKVKKCDWTAISPITEGEGATRRVNVRNITTDKDISGHLQTTKESKMECDVNLESGAITGLTKRMKLPLPDELHDELGENIKIETGQPTKGPVDTMTITTVSGHDIRAREPAASATIKCSTGEYQGKFQATVFLKGKVIFREADGRPLEQEVSEIMQDIPRDHLQAALPGLTFQGNEVIWTMTGHSEFTWDFEQTVEWHDEDPNTTKK